MDRINEVLASYKYPVLICLIGIVLIWFGSSSNNFTSSAPRSITIPKESLTKSENLKIKADIGGAVIKPGVYTLDKDSRLEDLIRVSGGLESSASAEFITKQLNLSQKISDGMKVYIPFKGEEKTTPVLSATAPLNGTTTTRPPGKVSINIATQSELESLPAVGPVTASKIISNRPYESIDQLVSKKSLGKATFEKIKDQIDL